MNIGLITYQTGHHKTCEVARVLLQKGHKVTLFAFPFHLHSAVAVGEDRALDHPPQLLGRDWLDIFKKNEVEIIKMAGWEAAHSQLFHLDNVDFPGGIFLHCTAKIIPPAFIGNRLILNCHPGLLPQNRGVDALKWSVINNWPIGVTLHIIDANIDRGTILTRWRTSLLPNDTLQDIFARVYRNSISLLAGFEEFIHYRFEHWEVGDEHPLSRKRLPLAADTQLEAIFLARRETLIENSTNKLLHPHKSNT